MPWLAIAVDSHRSLQQAQARVTEKGHVCIVVAYMIAVLQCEMCVYTAVQLCNEEITAKYRPSPALS